MDILICTDGSNSSIQSAELVSQLGFPSNSRVSVLGVSEIKSDVEKLSISMDLIDKKIGGKYKISRKIRYGDPIDEIVKEVIETPYDLVVVGGGGRQLGLLHPKLGSTTSNLARKLHTHFLVVRNIPEKIEKILVCVGTEAPVSETLSLGGAWIANTSAQIGLLHVVTMKKEHEPEAMKTGGKEKESPLKALSTEEGVMQNASQQLREVGVKNEIIPRLRRGLVVDEVLFELSDGSYELLVVGAHYQPGQDRWQGTLLDDITDQLLNRSTCSVLII